jgi:BolA protein
MRVADSIRAKLTEALQPVRLEIEDDSARHAGHPGHPGGAGQGGETHFNLVVVSERFAGCSRLERQRLIHQLLAEELAGPVHALSVKTLTPAELADK